MAKIEVRVEAVIYSSTGGILLAKHKKRGQSYWVLPGGHLEHGEILSRCIERELVEELYIDGPETKELVFVDEYIDAKRSRHIVKIGFLVELPAGYREKISVKARDESVSDVRFYTTEDLIDSKEVFYPSKEFFNELLELKEGEKTARNR